MLIGLTGPNASGKGTVGKRLIEKGYGYLSLSDCLRDELARRGRKVDRESLIALGNELREREGSGVLARMVLAKAKPGHSYVIDSIRHPAEVEVLTTRRDFILVLVDAPVAVRFERARRRGREADPVTYAAFLALEKRELAGSGSEHQQLALTMKMADYVLTNEGSVRELRRKVNKLIEDLTRPSSSPPSPSAPPSGGRE
jgi:dephospho-CoA kinase